MEQLTWIILLIPAFPLLGFLINALFVRSERPAGIIASAMVALAFVATIVAMVVLEAQPGEEKRINLSLWEWFSLGAFRVPFGFLFDQLTAVMALLITGVGTLIHIYSIGYMHGDSRPVRYFAALNLFIVAMLILVMGNNMLMLFLGWEGVGLCSFLLIGHYFDKRSVQPGIVPSEAAVKAFVANRVGDAAMLLGMMLIFSRFGTLNFYPTEIGGQALPGFLGEQVQNNAFQQVSLGIFGSITVVSAISFLLLIGVTGKSAQAPLFVWLPDAMAGPTPVSALIHAATMVTAGVYLIARTSGVFQAAADASGWVVGIGAFTALLAASAAIVQFDIKRVLAYSTISQLGYMIAAVGMGAVTAGMFHLLTHGLFKALLFLAAGSIIHGTHETQDMRKMGGLRTKMPTTFWMYMIGALALAGVAPLAGFWSKDEILAYALDLNNPRSNVGVGVLLILTSLLTAFYMGRQVALIFWGKQRDTSYDAHESPSIMTVPLIILGIATVIGGVMNLPEVHWLGHYLEPVTRETEKAFTTGKLILAIVTTLLAAAAFYGGWYLYARVIGNRIKIGKDDPIHRYLGDIWRGAEIAWGFDWFYNRMIVRPYRVAARFLSNVFDRQAIDGILVDGTARSFGALAAVLRSLQNGYVRVYALAFLVGVIILIGIFTFRS
jgi:NADH-quinone oxidoreductase subunit L